jgi:hypothetical protein
MWRGFESDLCKYAIAICQEWRARGYNDTLLDFFKSFPPRSPKKKFPWLGHPEFHEQYRRLLLGKNPEHYERFFRTLQPIKSIDWSLWSPRSRLIHPSGWDSPSE